MSRREYKFRKCKVCGKEFFGVQAYCSLECLHSTNRAVGDYKEKRKILNYMLEHPEVSSRKIAKIFGVTKSVTERLAYFTDRKRIYKEVNEDYFEVIDTEDKAYWLGMLYADGYVKKRKGNSCIIELCLAEIDKNHVIKFKNSVNANEDIKVKYSKINNKVFTSYRFAIYREKMYKDLVMKGCVENKSLILKFPNMNIFTDKGLIKHFIRGYVDGDGTIGIYGGKPTISIIGTEAFLNGILNWIKQDCSIITKAKPNRCTSKGKENIFCLSFSNVKALQIINYLYKDSTIYLDRKYERYIRIYDIYKDVL